MIYELPPRPLAHLMRPEEIPGVDVPEHPGVLTRYVAAIEDLNARRCAPLGLRPATIRWRAHSARPSAAAGECRLRLAPQDGREIAITADTLGFVVLHPAILFFQPHRTAILGYPGTTPHGRPLRRLMDRRAVHVLPGQARLMRREYAKTPAAPPSFRAQRRHRNGSSTAYTNQMA